MVDKVIFESPVNTLDRKYVITQADGKQTITFYDKKGKVLTTLTLPKTVSPRSKLFAELKRRCQRLANAGVFTTLKDKGPKREIIYTAKGVDTNRIFADLAHGSKKRSLVVCDWTARKKTFTLYTRSDPTAEFVSTGCVATTTKLGAWAKYQSYILYMVDIFRLYY